MAYAFVQDVAASWERYELETAVAIYPAPEGLILHLAGPTAEGFRVIEVWEDEAAWLGFRDGRLAPVLASMTRPAIPEPTFRDVRVVHLVVRAVSSYLDWSRSGSTAGCRLEATHDAALRSGAACLQVFRDGP
jgi:hypothetical protein